MRVLYVIDSLVPGGAERSLAALAPRYVALGVELDVAYLVDRPGLHEELALAGATLFNVAGGGGRLGRIRRLRALAASREPDLVHTTLFESDVAGRFAARLARRPVVSSFVNPAYGPEQLADRRLPRWRVRGAQLLDATTAHLATRFHAITPSVADVMCRRLFVPRDRVDVVPRGRDPEALGRATPERRRRIRRSLSIDQQAPVVLAAARQEYQKGLDVLVEAFPAIRSRIPEAIMLIAGREGAETDRLRRLVQELRLGGSVRFLGTRGDVPDLLAGADVFVLPSRWEGLGSVLLEAMALEAPIVASDLPAVHDTLDGARGGVLVPPERPEPLAEAIVSVLRDGAAERVTWARTRFLERFALDRVANAMIEFYERALSRA